MTWSRELIYEKSPLLLFVVMHVILCIEVYLCFIFDLCHCSGCEMEWECVISLHLLLNLFDYVEGVLMLVLLKVLPDVWCL